jgi:hypothetical protein
MCANLQLQRGTSARWHRTHLLAIHFTEGIMQLPVASLPSPLAALTTGDFHAGRSTSGQDGTTKIRVQVPGAAEDAANVAAA